MTEQQIQNNDPGTEQSTPASNVVPFAPVAHRASSSRAEPTEEELAEYRQMLPILRQIVKEFPQLLRQHQAITSNCVLAKQILAGDP